MKYVCKKENRLLDAHSFCKSFTTQWGMSVQCTLRDSWKRGNIRLWQWKEKMTQFLSWFNVTSFLSLSYSLCVCACARYFLRLLLLLPFLHLWITWISSWLLHYLSVVSKTCNFCEPKRKLWEGSENLSCIFNNKKRKSLTITSLIYLFIAYCHSVLIPLYLKRTIASLIVIWRDEKMCKLVHESPKRILLLRWWWFARCKILLLLLSCASNVQCGIQGKMYENSVLSAQWWLLCSE